MEKECYPFVEFQRHQFTISPTDTSPIEGYEKPEGFPNDSVFHKSAFEDANTWFEKFPDCCDRHREMAAKGQVRKSSYEGWPLKILTNLSYTEHFILTEIDAPDWFGDITDYIDYAWWSFGHPNIGVDRYNRYLKHFVSGTTDKIPNDKRQRLIEYINAYYGPSKREMASKSDLRTLYETYQKWLKTFPFDLIYFKELRSQFEGKIPAFKGTAKLNPFTGMAKAQALRQDELIDALEANTKRLLGEVQTEKMVAEDQIPDIGKHRMELANESLRVGTAKLVKEYSKGELRYVTTVKKWLELQKKYFREVADIMEKRPAGPPPGVTLRPEFVNLFISEAAAHRAINAAVATDIIDKTGKKRLGQRQIVPAIIQFWEAVSDRKFELTHLRAEKDAIAETYVQQCGTIAMQFGARISKTAIYDNAGKRAGKHFTAVARALGGT